MKVLIQCPKRNLRCYHRSGMQCSDRKVVMTIVGSHGFHYTAACLQMLCLECRLAYAQMNDIRVCVIVTREHPEMIEFNIPELGLACSVATMPQAVVVSNANKSSVNNNLKMFMLIPKNDAGVPLLKGEKPFIHMCRFQNIQHAASKGRGENEDEITPLEPSGGLSVFIYTAIR